MLIAQISDTHMLPPGEIAYGLVDTERRLEAAVERINAIKPDLVLHTGDIAHHGAPAAYELTFDILGGLEAPLYAIPGNHDDRANLRAAGKAFSWMPEPETPDAFIQFVVDAGDVALIALDTLIPGKTEGALCDARLEWLAGALAETEGRPTIVALHHPPFSTGLAGFSPVTLEHPDRLAGLLGGHNHVVRVIAGHLHRSIVGVCGRTPVVVAPSASFPFAFDTAADAALSISFEDPGLAMHLWRPDVGLLSHVVPLDDAPAARPLIRNGERLLPTSTPRAG